MHLTMDALVLQHRRVRFSSWTRPLKSRDASAVLGGHVQSEVRLRPTKIWTRPGSIVDAPGICGKRFQTRPYCVYHFYGRVQGGGLMCNRYCKDAASGSVISPFASNWGLKMEFISGTDSDCTIVSNAHQSTGLACMLQVF